MSPPLGRPTESRFPNYATVYCTLSVRALVGGDAFSNLTAAALKEGRAPA
jgi:hypothetical protein